ncbi:MAG: OadG-related small transporter subunit [Pseudomonadota bacterium]
MEPWSFGLTMLVVAGGGTFVTLWLLGLMVGLLKRLFPLPPDKPADDR